jgi:hypothetical protein
MSTTEANQGKSRFEKFSEDAKKDIDTYKERLVGDGTFSYVGQVIMLERLSHYMNRNMLVYLFGELLGDHLAETFAHQCNHNLLSFLSRLNSEYRFFILHELKNNKILFSYC